MPHVVSQSNFYISEIQRRIHRSPTRTRTQLEKEDYLPSAFYHWILDKRLVNPLVILTTVPQSLGSELNQHRIKIQNFHFVLRVLV